VNCRPNSVSVGNPQRGADKAHRLARGHRQNEPRKKRGLSGFVKTQHRHGTIEIRSGRGYLAIPFRNTASRDVELSVQSLSSCQLIERFHVLADKELNDTLMTAEAFELSRIEARLDSEDQADVDRQSGFQNSWATERSQLIDSIENLMTVLRAG